MAAKVVRVGFRLTVLLGILVVAFYIGRPLYWKLSATLHDIREKDYTHEAVKEGFSNLMYEAQKSVGWGSGTETLADPDVSKTNESKKDVKMKSKVKKPSSNGSADSVIDPKSSFKGSKEILKSNVKPGGKEIPKKVVLPKSESRKLLPKQ